MDLRSKSLKLLELLANSIHDRDTTNHNLFFFTVSEVNVAEKWLNELAEDLKKDCICV